MLPKWHVLFGSIFTLVLYFVFAVSLKSCLIFFLASVFIDVDHYLFYAFRNNDWNLKKSYKWYIALGKNHKPILHLLHTIEFIFSIFLLSFIFNFFLFVLIGFLFHSILDLVDMLYEKNLEVREFFLTRYLLTKNKSKYL